MGCTISALVAAVLLFGLGIFSVIAHSTQLQIILFFGLCALALIFSLSSYSEYAMEKKYEEERRERGDDGYSGDS